MYFWKTDRLIAEINNHSLNENDCKNYYLASTLAMVLSMYLVMIVPSKEILISTVEIIVTTIINIIGINAAFAANGGKTGSRFIEKALIICFPLTVKAFVVGISLGLLAGIVGTEVGATDLQLTWIGFFVNTTIQAVLFWRLTIFVGKTAHG